MRAPESVSPLIRNHDQIELFPEFEVNSEDAGLGVLDDGTPFLTQRGLAKICGGKNNYIGQISSQWHDVNQKPRVKEIKNLLSENYLIEYLESPHEEMYYHSKLYYVYREPVCLAIMEYYGFLAGENCKREARKRLQYFIREGFRKVVYDLLGYEPKKSAFDPWRQFRDRLSITQNSVLEGYFSVFREAADLVVHLGEHGIFISDKFMPDISIGKIWSNYWRTNNLSVKSGGAKQYPHNYPDYFPQAISSPQACGCYPDEALPEFRK